MSIHRRKYTKDFKIELVERVLSGKSTLEVASEEGLNPDQITRWKKQYLGGKFHGTSNSDSELRKLKLKICELEQMLGKLTMENYLLKKEKEFIAAAKKENSYPLSGPDSNHLRRLQN